MGVDTDAMAHVMGLLSDLYTQPILAVIREYSTNAWDSHVEAGTTRPIEVTLPNPLSLYLKIQDFGVGLSAEEIASVYSQYGRSTKRESDDLNGMLGIGCKSAFAYTNSFTVTAIKDGLCSRVSFSRDENMAGRVITEEPFETDRESGVTVSIPVRMGEDDLFRQWAEHLYSFWPEGSVLVNGEPPKTFAEIRGENCLKVDDQFSIVRDKDSFVVMGNVPYRVSRHKMDVPLNSAFSVVANIPIGSVDIPPHRESVKDTNYTNETLAALAEDFSDRIFEKIQEDIDSSENRKQALQKRRHWRRMVNQNIVDLVKYKGEDIPEFIDLGKENNVRIIPRRTGHKLSESDKEFTVEPDTLSRAIVFLNFDRVTWTPGARKKLDLWMKEKWPNDTEPDFSCFVVMRDDVDRTWIDDSLVFNWPDVQAIKLPRNAMTKSGRIAGSYDVFSKSKYDIGVEANSIDTSLPIFYDISECYWSYTYLFDELYGEGKYTIVEMGERRVPKFLRMFPTARSCVTVFSEEKEKWVASLPEEDKLAIAYSRMGGPIWYFESDEIEDLDFKRALELRERNVNGLRDRSRKFGRGFFDSISTSDVETVDFRKRYPLLYEFTSWSVMDKENKVRSHLIEYINMIYRSEYSECHSN